MKKIFAVVLIISFSGCSLFQKTEPVTNQLTETENSATENQTDTTVNPDTNTSVTEVTVIDPVFVPEPDYKNEAIKNLDLSQCDNISDQELKANCQEIVRVEVLRNASEKQDNSLCEKLASEKDKNDCNALVLPK